MKPDQNTIQEICRLMEEAFPPTERRNRAGQVSLFSHPAYRVFPVERDGRLIAFAACWALESCTFLEHIAVDPACRGGGIGAELVKKIQNSCPAPLVLESEPEGATPMAARRLGFYRRLGFHIAPFAYEQPSLQAGQPPIPLRILSWPRELTEEEFERIRGELMAVVYTAGRQEGPAREKPKTE